MKKIKLFASRAANNRVLLNSGWLISEKIITMLIALVTTAIIARYFGPEGYGLYSYALAFTTLFIAVSTLGLETLTIKSLTEKKFDEGTILCTSLLLRVFGAILLVVLTSGTIRYIEPNALELYWLVLLISLASVIKAFEVIEYWIQANQLSKISSIIRIVAYVLSALLKFLLVLNNGSLILLAGIYIIDALLIAIGLIIAYKTVRANKSKWNFNFSYATSVLSQSWYLIFSSMLVTIYMQIDKIMIGFYYDSKYEVGVYTAATQVAMMWFFVPLSIITAFSPVIMKIQDQVRRLEVVQKLYVIIVWLSISFSVATTFLSNLVINILYGSEYSGASNILIVSVWAGVFAMLGSARSLWFISNGLQRYIPLFTGSGAVVNIALNIIFIPKYGVLGAAITTLVSQIVVAIVAPLFFEKTRVSSIMMLKAFNIFKAYERINRGNEG